MKIKIKKAELIHIRLPLKERFEISSGYVEKKDSIIVRLFTDDFTGYGDSPPMPGPFYSSETPYTCLHVMKDFLIPGLAGRSFDKIEDLSDIFEAIRGNNFAKAGVEMALWDLLSKYEGRPLHEFIGGQKKDIAWKISIGIKPSIERLLDTVENFLDKGLKHIKIKIKKDWDIEPVDKIRKRFGNISLSVDANSFYSLNDLDLFKKLDNYDLKQIEQPLNHDDLYDHCKLRNEIKTPICLDESISGLTTARNALEMGSCDIVNIKIQRVGGIANAIAIHDMCKHKRIPVWIGCMPDSGIGHAAGLALCSLSNVTYPCDISPTGTYFSSDIISPGIELNESKDIMLLGDPGIGTEIREDIIDHLKVDSILFEM